MQAMRRDGLREIRVRLTLAMGCPRLLQDSKIACLLNSSMVFLSGCSNATVANPWHSAIYPFRQLVDVFLCNARNTNFGFKVFVSRFAFQNLRSSSSNGSSFSSSSVLVFFPIVSHLASGRYGATSHLPNQPPHRTSLRPWDTTASISID